MVIVFFPHTVETQNAVLDDEPAGRQHHRGRRPAVVVDLQLRRRRDATTPPTTTPTDHEFPYSSYVYEAGTGSQDPDARAAGRRDHPLQPALARRDPRLRRPGVPDEDGRHPGPREPLRDHADHAPATYKGKCYELCGVYHSRMLFNVKVVEPGASTSSTSRSSQDAGQTSRAAAARRRRRPHPGRARVRRPSPRRRGVTATPHSRRPFAGGASRSASRSSGSSPRPTTS